MIISDEQVRLAMECLHEPCAPRSSEKMDRSPVDPALVDRVKLSLAALPDTREDRVRSAREDLGSDGIDSGVIASKLIGRVISDSLR